MNTITEVPTITADSITEAAQERIAESSVLTSTEAPQNNNTGNLYGVIFPAIGGLSIVAFITVLAFVIIRFLENSCHRSAGRGAGRVRRDYAGDEKRRYEDETMRMQEQQRIQEEIFRQQMQQTQDELQRQMLEQQMLEFQMQMLRDMEDARRMHEEAMRQAEFQQQQQQQEFMNQQFNDFNNGF